MYKIISALKRCCSPEESPELETNAKTISSPGCLEETNLLTGTNLFQHSTIKAETVNLKMTFEFEK